MLSPSIISVIRIRYAQLLGAVNKINQHKAQLENELLDTDASLVKITQMMSELHMFLEQNNETIGDIEPAQPQTTYYVGNVPLN